MKNFTNTLLVFFLLSSCTSMNTQRKITNIESVDSYADDFYYNSSSIQKINIGSRAFFKDSKTGYIWTDIIADNVLYGKAIDICPSLNISQLPGSRWRLPSIEDYIEGYENGLGNYMEKKNYHTITLLRMSSDMYYFDSFFKKGQIASPTTKKAAVRCIARSK